MATTFSNKVKILSQFWEQYRFNDEYSDFVEYNDLGLPLAHLNEQGLAVITTEGENYIAETFEYLLARFDCDDNDFTELEEIFTSASQG
jgi:hypothetical protein